MYCNRRIEFIECVRDSYLYQHITDPTRARGNNKPSTIDLVFTNDNDIVESIEFSPPLGASDHCCIHTKIECYPVFDGSDKIVFKYDKADFTKMRETLAINWEKNYESYPDDVHKQWNFFYDRYENSSQHFECEIHPCKHGFTANWFDVFSRNAFGSAPATDQSDCFIVGGRHLSRSP